MEWVLACQGGERWGYVEAESLLMMREGGSGCPPSVFLDLRSFWSWQVWDWGSAAYRVLLSISSGQILTHPGLPGAPVRGWGEGREPGQEVTAGLQGHWAHCGP